VLNIYHILVPDPSSIPNTTALPPPPGEGALPSDSVTATNQVIIDQFWALAAENEKMLRLWFVDCCLEIVLEFACGNNESTNLVCIVLTI
jgi:hypothetical protein